MARIKLVTTTATVTPVAPKGRPARTAKTWTAAAMIPQLRQWSALPVERCSQPCEPSTIWKMPRKANDAEEETGGAPLFPQQDDDQVFGRHRQDRRRSCSMRAEQSRRKLALGGSSSGN